MVFEQIPLFARVGFRENRRQGAFLKVLLCFFFSLPGGGSAQCLKNLLKHLMFFNCCFSIVVSQLSFCNWFVAIVVLQLMVCNLCCHCCCNYWFGTTEHNCKTNIEKRQSKTNNCFSKFWKHSAEPPRAANCDFAKKVADPPPLGSGKKMCIFPMTPSLRNPPPPGNETELLQNY